MRLLKNKYLLILVLAIITLALIYTAVNRTSTTQFTSNPNLTNSWETYKNGEFKIELKYPNDWKIDPKSDQHLIEKEYLYSVYFGNLINPNYNKQLQFSRYFDHSSPNFVGLTINFFRKGYLLPLDVKQEYVSQSTDLVRFINLMHAGIGGLNPEPSKEYTKETAEIGGYVAIRFFPKKIDSIHAPTPWAVKVGDNIFEFVLENNRLDYNAQVFNNLLSTVRFTN